MSEDSSAKPAGVTVSYKTVIILLIVFIALLVVAICLFGKDRDGSASDTASSGLSVNGSAPSVELGKTTVASYVEDENGIQYRSGYLADSDKAKAFSVKGVMIPKGKMSQAFTADDVVSERVKVQRGGGILALVNDETIVSLPADGRFALPKNTKTVKFYSLQGDFSIGLTQ